MTVIERIKAALDNDRPSTVEWRAMLETALFEIERQAEEIEALREQIPAPPPEC